MAIDGEKKKNEQGDHNAVFVFFFSRERDRRGRKRKIKNKKLGWVFKMSSAENTA